MSTLDHLIVWGFRTLEVMFFVGLIGCLFTVIISWVSIFKEGFTDKG